MGAGGDKSGIISPGGGPFGRRAAPEPNKRALYVGGLDPRVTEDVLRQIFETTGHVQSVKIIPDKNVRLQFFYSLADQTPMSCGISGQIPASSDSSRAGSAASPFDLYA
jgi:hypothetical protein